MTPTVLLPILEQYARHFTKSFSCVRFPEFTSVFCYRPASRHGSSRRKQYPLNTSIVQGSELCHRAPLTPSHQQDPGTAQPSAPVSCVTCQQSKRQLCQGQRGGAEQICTSRYPGSDRAARVAAPQGPARKQMNAPARLQGSRVGIHTVLPRALREQPAHAGVLTTL